MPTLEGLVIAAVMAALAFGNAIYWRRRYAKEDRDGFRE